ncbi:hypothetical protein [Streptomyces sp. NBC_01443]|uniref:hypothetical protein n=1 Tax=Streptomyces sp. NBC_01443 TaxID=2903868 RepID=UPI00224D232B|nr:hypothetical protein [Streptomyces sp. NBC_01443]MCX4632143.1 hypothetical protein [Streptomyces sp. NBC_01443]
MSGRRRLDWLGLTPEPERELPVAVAALRAPYPASPSPPPEAPAPAEEPAAAEPPTEEPAAAELAAAERRRVERLVLRGSRHGWLRYLAEVTELVTSVAEGSRPGDRAAALLAAEVVLDHHRMLIGLPGTGYGRTAEDRTALESAVRTLRAPTRTGGMQ